MICEIPGCHDLAEMAVDATKEHRILGVCPGCCLAYFAREKSHRITSTDYHTLQQWKVHPIYRKYQTEKM